jgi:hypothetical protein
MQHAREARQRRKGEIDTTALPPPAERLRRVAEETQSDGPRQGTRERRLHGRRQNAIAAECAALPTSRRGVL